MDRIQNLLMPIKMIPISNSSLFPRKFNIRRTCYTYYKFINQQIISILTYWIEQRLLNFKGATKSYFKHYSCVVIAFFDAALCRSAFSTVYFRKLVFPLSVLFLNQIIKIASSCYVILIYNFVLTLYKNSPFINTCCFFYKHIKFSDEARLCLSYHKIKAGVMLTVCLLQ